MPAVNRMDHDNRKLDITVPAGDLEHALAFLLAAAAGTDAAGRDPLNRPIDPAHLAWRRSSDGRGLYLGLGFPCDGMDGWAVSPAHCTAAWAAGLTDDKLPQPVPDGPGPQTGRHAVHGYRITDPRGAAKSEPDPAALEGAFAYIERYVCVRALRGWAPAQEGGSHGVPV